MQTEMANNNNNTNKTTSKSDRCQTDLSLRSTSYSDSFCETRVQVPKIPLTNKASY